MTNVGQGIIKSLETLVEMLTIVITLQITIELEVDFHEKSKFYLDLTHLD